MTSPNIVVLDGSTLNPGDNPWTDLQQLGNVTVYENSLPDEVVERARGHEVVVVNKVKLPAKFFEQVPELRLVAVTATGWDCVDGHTARQHDVPVCNVPIYGTDSVAQFTFALLLELCHHVGLHNRCVQAGEWEQASSFCFWKTPLLELSGLTLGIIGFGRIGRRVGELGHAFGMQVLAASRSNTDPPTYSGFSWGSIDEVFSKADVISLHCPLVAEAESLVNQSRLNSVKPGALLINTSRGGLVEEKDLAEALTEGRLAGAAVDVVSEEPIRSDNPLLSLENCLITPHMAWATLAARRRLMETTVSNVSDFLEGHPSNIVN